MNSRTIGLESFEARVHELIDLGIVGPDIAFSASFANLVRLHSKEEDLPKAIMRSYIEWTGCRSLEAFFRHSGVLYSIFKFGVLGGR